MQRAIRVVSLGGTAVVVATLAKYHAVDHAYDYTTSTRFAWTVGYTSLLCLASYSTGLPDVVRGRRQVVAAALGAPALAALGVSVVQLFIGDALLPRFVVFGAAVALVPWHLFCVSAASGGRWLAEERDRVLVVGNAGEAENLRFDLLVRPERPAQIVRALEIDEASSLEEAVEQHRATVLVLTRDAQEDERLVHQAALLHERGLRVRTLAMFSEQWLGKLPVSELERTSLMFDIREVHRAVYGRIARLLDIVLSTLGIVALAFVVPVVVVGNLLANRGPLFYRQPRVGKNGSVFRILKFRTMRPEYGTLVNEWTTESDPRITPFGRILRVSHLDELPQVLNIFKGDLSVVGPRPEQPHYVEELTAKIPFYNLRHLVRPGLTGWAQVKYGYAGSESDALEKLQYEFYYLRHQSLLLDLRIISRTVRSVFGGRGR